MFHIFFRECTKGFFLVILCKKTHGGPNRRKMDYIDFERGDASSILRDCVFLVSTYNITDAIKSLVVILTDFMFQEDIETVKIARAFAVIASSMFLGYFTYKLQKSFSERFKMKSRYSRAQKKTLELVDEA
jgi:D-alanyl-lipoteichoic acid acyltransferase DltB (MBOAT superfamily)